MSIGQLVKLDSGEVYALGFEPMTIGRHGSNGIILADQQVSRHHAEIAMQGDRWLIRDLGSANGTYLNGRRIEKPHVLSPGDTVRLGQATFRVDLPGRIAEQDTLVERLPVPAAAAPVASGRSGPPWLVVGLLLAVLLAVIVVGVLVVWPRLQGEGDLAQGGTVTQVVPTAAAPTGAEPSALPTAEAGAPAPTAGAVPSRPTTTAIPTVPPPSPEATVFLPTAEPLPTDTPPARPTIGYFRADRTTIEQGRCARLEWGDVQDANSLELGGVGRVSFSGKLDVCLDNTKAYTLKATGPGGTTEKSVQIAVQAPVGPVIEYFRVVPSIIAPGDCAQLEWGTVGNAVSATIEPGIGGVGTPGTQEVCPGSTTTYVLTAQGASAASTAGTTLIVSSGAGPKPVISFFTANPAHIEAGECTTLTWGKVDYATSVTIDHGIGGVATPGSKEICLGKTTTFVMIAVGSGGTVEHTLAVDVSPGQLANQPDLVVESILFEPNPCYWGQNCKVRVKVRNDGSRLAKHFVVHWAPVGEEVVPVEWDVDQLRAAEEKILSYNWIPNRTDDNWRTVATVDANEEVTEIGEGVANYLEQFITVLEP